MSPGRLRLSKQAYRKRAACNAYNRYSKASTNAAWNQFVRVYVKAGGDPTITRKNASNFYGRLNCPKFIY